MFCIACMSSASRCELCEEREGDIALLRWLEISRY
jgi:hypothetical protein